MTRVLPGPTGIPPRDRGTALRRRAARLSTLLAAGALLVAAGCGGDDDDDPGVPSDAARATLVAVDGWRLLETSLLAHGAAFEGRRRRDEGAPHVVPAGAPRGGLTPLHEFGLDCPDVTINPTANALRIFVVYGDAGCVSELTGATHSGFVELTVDLSGAPESVTGSMDISEYTTGNYLIDGTIGAVFADSSFILDASRVLVDGPEAASAVTACLGVTFHNAGTRADIADDSYTILGTASVEDATMLAEGPIVYLEVQPEEPLRVLATCAWPVAGRLEVRTEGAPTAVVDFGEGACDDDATVTVLGQTVTVSLAHPSAPAAPTPRSLPSKP